MSELALRRKSGLTESVVQFSSSNVNAVTVSASTGAQFYGQRRSSLISMIGLTATNKSGSFTVNNLDACLSVGDTKYNDAIALFTIDGACRLPGDNTRTYIDRSTGYGYGQRSCMPSVVGVLTNASDSCSITVPFVIEAVRAWYRTYSGGDTLYWESEQRTIWAEGEMTFNVSFGNDSSGKKCLVVDWFFNGSVDNAGRSKYGTPVEETIRDETQIALGTSYTPYINFKAMIAEGEV